MKIKETLKDIISLFSSKTKKPGAYANSGYMGYGSRSGGAKFPYGLSASGNTRVLDHFTLRQNARDAYQDTPQAKALVDRWADTIVDVGLKLESTPDAKILKKNQEELEDWREEVDARFDLWCASKKQHRAETMTFYQYQRLYAQSGQRDNDMFTRLYYASNRDLMNPLQFSGIDANQIRGYAFTSTYTQYNQRDGIKRDGRGRELSYKVWLQQYGKNDDPYKFETIPRIGPKSKRVFMLHGFTPEYVGQGRGYSRLAHALQEFENITDFSLAQIKKAINQSSITMYVKPGKDNPSSNPFENILTGEGAAPVVEQFGSDPQPVQDAQNVNPVSCYRMPEATIEKPGSTAVFNLAEGEDLAPFKATAPSESFDSFVNSFCSYLSASLSMPIEVMLMKFNQNYSASRASLILFWRVAQIWRAEMESDLLNPVYEMWLSEEIAAARILAPGWQDPILREAWMSARWLGSPMPNIDPMRTAKADKEYVDMGAQTLDRVARNLNGSNGKANRSKLTREFTELPSPPWQNGSAQGEDNSTENKKPDNKNKNNSASAAEIAEAVVDEIEMRKD